LALIALLLSSVAASAQPPSSEESGPNAAAGCASAACGCIPAILVIALVVVSMVGMWKVFDKAGKPGWASIVPIYNLYILMEIAEKPMMWFILALIPCVNIYIMIMVALEVAKKFGKDQMYGIGLALLPFVFYPMLGFSSAQYQGTGRMPAA
jgi:hypothetical protein